jgi:putative transposase
LDEICVKMNGERHYLWRAADHEGEDLESVVTKKRDKKAALKFLSKAMRKHGGLEMIVTDRLRSYGAALKELGASHRQETGRWLNNRAGNAHLPFRRRERAMLRFGRMRSLQEFAAIPASVCNQFNSEGSLTSRTIFKLNCGAALAEWRGLCVDQQSRPSATRRLVRICLPAPAGLLACDEGSSTCGAASRTAPFHSTLMILRASTAWLATSSKRISYTPGSSGSVISTGGSPVIFVAEIHVKIA